jgi:hypothetical protein
LPYNTGFNLNYQWAIFSLRVLTAPKKAISTSWQTVSGLDTNLAGEAEEELHP